MGTTRISKGPRLNNIPTAHWNIAVDWLMDQTSEEEVLFRGPEQTEDKDEFRYLRWAKPLEALLVKRIGARSGFATGGPFLRPVTLFRTSVLCKLFYYLFEDDGQIYRRHTNCLTDCRLMLPGCWEPGSWPGRGASCWVWRPSWDHDIGIFLADVSQQAGRDHLSAYRVDERWKAPPEHEDDVWFLLYPRWLYPTRRDAETAQKIYRENLPKSV